MTNIAVVNKDKLKGIFDTDELTTITPISEEEADEIEFKSLKGIAGRPLNADEVRKGTVRPMKVMLVSSSAVLKRAVTERDIDTAFARNWKDFEDSVQYTAAEANNVDCIVTRDKTDFEENEIPSYSPLEFVEKFS